MYINAIESRTVMCVLLYTTYFLPTFLLTLESAARARARAARGLDARWRDTACAGPPSCATFHVSNNKI